MDREEAKRIYKEKTSVYFQEGMKLLQKKLGFKERRINADDFTRVIVFIFT